MYRLAKNFNMELLYKKLTGTIVDCAISVHKTLGPGLLESSYEECLHYELTESGLKCLREIPMPLIYKGKKLDIGYRIDLLVEDKVIIEVKSVEVLNPVHLAQLMTYLKLSGRRIGLLINFNVAFLKEGLKRIIL
jgi:GxxExxY protein